MAAVAAPIAVRTLQWVDGGERHDVVVRVWAPEAWQKEYVCDFAIDGLPENVRANSVGVDSLQALVGALIGIRGHLDPHRAHLSWLGQPEDDGVPRMLVTFDPTEARYLDALIDAEIAHSLALIERPWRERRDRYVADHGLVPLPPLRDLSLDELGAVLRVETRRERGCEEAQDETGARVSMERRHAVTRELMARPGFERIFDELVASGDARLASWAAGRWFPHPTALAVLETLARADDDDGRQAKQLLAQLRLEASRPKPWDDAG